MNTDTTAILSEENVATLASGKILRRASYEFRTQGSINLPFGTLDVILFEGDSGEMAAGSVVIDTLIAMGTHTVLKYQGLASVNGSTGYTSVNTIGRGTTEARPNPPKPITAKISIALAPTFQTGTLSVEGFISDYALSLVSDQAG